MELEDRGLQEEWFPEGEGRVRKVKKKKTDILLNVFKCIGSTLVFHSMMNYCIEE